MRAEFSESVQADDPLGLDPIKVVIQEQLDEAKRRAEGVVEVELHYRQHFQLEINESLLDVGLHLSKWFYRNSGCLSCILLLLIGQFEFELLSCCEWFPILVRSLLLFLLLLRLPIRAHELDLLLVVKPLERFVLYMQALDLASQVHDERARHQMVELCEWNFLLEQVKDLVCDGLNLVVGWSTLEDNLHVRAFGLVAQVLDEFYGLHD